ncbi:AraC family transcriptional regulator [Alcanivorax hongdengensis A-11-3]|uniref:AraC family transcriptional regulator n=1 Tax=Alcanivorax hongdengensis A-11-3 TaxID=1177179 RepID=L0WDE7_9GAMM|nr:AraC family transcriptional regulator [Alcanivorax hongdengensis]EKF75021.1 AraC family transcriptional regulator [Alcanivorax hongdengensis A-11-3]
MSTTLLPASILPGLMEVSLRSKVNAQWLFDRAGIDADIVGRSDRFIRLEQLDELLFTAFTQSDDALFGLHVGADNHYGNLDLLGNLMATAATLEQGLAVLFCYKDLLVPYLRFSLTHNGGRARLAVTSQEPALRFLATRTHNELIVATMVSIGRSLLGGEMPVRAVGFVHSSPPTPLLSEYQRFFACDLLFDQSENAIEFDTSLLSLPLPGAYPKYHQRLQQAAEQMRDGLNRAAGISGRVMEQLANLLGGEPPTIDVLAARLAMTPRTLQRRLQEEGTSFARLRDRVRHQHACDALQQAQCDMSSLAQYLGFSDTANFYHAFKRWQGCAPGQYRKQQRSVG